MNPKDLSRKCPICNCSSGEVLHTQCFALSEGHPLQSSYDFVACDSCGFCFADNRSLGLTNPVVTLSEDQL
jgi:hypothetical protein